MNDPSNTSREEFTLLTRSAAAITDVAALEDLTRDQVVNHAVQMYAFLVAERRIGNSVFMGRTWTLRIRLGRAWVGVRFGLGLRELVWEPEE
jgi:hypothetical protein